MPATESRTGWSTTIARVGSSARTLWRSLAAMTAASPARTTLVCVPSVSSSVPSMTFQTSSLGCSWSWTSAPAAIS